ncbi:MAG: hypothetical protein EHM89_13155 [Acidobacteria bacterium]|nr:MAG: hypothetical protein EHM89_13155 [Acidobacteriota bacterium]
MSLRAEQWVMLGVVGLGLYAVYRFSKADSRQPTADSEAKQPSGPRMDLPVTAGAIGMPPPGIPFITGPDPNRPTPVMHLTNSRAYRGRGEGLTEDDLVALGLDSVQLYTSPQAARAALTPEWALANAGQNTRWFYGRYLGPTTDVRRPAALQAAWIVAGPPPRVAGLGPWAM